MAQRSLDEYTLTTTEIAEKLGYTRSYVCDLAAAGLIPALKRRRQWLFSEGAIMDYLRAETEKATSRGDKPGGQETRGPGG